MSMTAWQIENHLRPYMTQVEVIEENGKPTNIICSGTVARWNSLLSPSLTMEMVRDARVQTLSTIQHAPNWTHEQWMVAIDVMNMFEARFRQQMEKSRPAVEQ